MKKCIFPSVIFLLSLFSLPVFSQTKQDTASLGLAGDNLDLYAVLNLFLKSKTIEGFEKSLNEQKTGINNLDLDLDGKVDFIKVVTKKEDNAYTFILQVAVSKTETQDVAVILVNRDKNNKVNVQIVGDEDLYGKDYVIEPKPEGSSSVTANPAYVGPDPVTKDVPATTTVVVQTAPIVQYVYSPVYVPYYPPYHYGYYPPYFAAFTVMAVGIYRHNNYYYHGGYYGGHYGGHYGGGNTVIINNRNQINHYNNSRNTSNRVQHNNASGNYGNRGGSGGNRPSTGGPSASTRPSNGPSASTRPSNNGPSASTRQSNGPSASTRQSASNFSSSGRTRSSGGGGYSGGGSKGGGGGFSGGGGGGRRR